MQSNYIVTIVILEDTNKNTNTSHFNKIVEQQQWLLNAIMANPTNHSRRRPFAEAAAKRSNKLSFPTERILFEIARSKSTRTLYLSLSLGPAQIGPCGFKLVFCHALMT
jgi:hypothetical protein